MGTKANGTPLDRARADYGANAKDKLRKGFTDQELGQLAVAVLKREISAVAAAKAIGIAKGNAGSAMWTATQAAYRLGMIQIMDLG